METSSVDIVFNITYNTNKLRTQKASTELKLPATLTITHTSTGIVSIANKSSVSRARHVQFLAADFSISTSCMSLDSGK